MDCMLGGGVPAGDMCATERRACSGETDRLDMELRARDWERWQLLQLLHEKEAQLARQASDARAQHRASLRSTRAAALHWLARCALRAWRDGARRSETERLVSRTRHRVVAAKVAQACGALGVAMRVAVVRRLASGFRAIASSAAFAQNSPRRLGFRRDM
eukprot:TRINITY_DN71145_c0_g1_i1.p1 TRINITY_DN71145_c0_g1~~TRINITY_DN71145_c0_g1_i1.p1  ORF type:complete len:160 (-),score=26.45 TRINITY_DN71145_c0_g1_i1:39-518(-)